MAAGDEQRAHLVVAGGATASRAQVATDGDEERQPGHDLHEDASTAPSPHAPVEAEHEEDLEHEVDPVGGEQDHQRCAVVGGAALDALGAERQQHERQAEGGDPQVRDGEVEHVAVAAEPAADRRGGDDDDGRQHDADDRRQPHRLHADVGGVVGSTGTEAPRHPLGRAVGEEVAAGDDEAEHGGGEGQPAELGRPQAPDDRRVDEHVQRLGRQAPQRRQRQPDDPPIGCRGRWQRAGPTSPSGWRGQEADGVVGPLEGGRGHGAGLVGALAQQRCQLAGSASSSR